MDDQNKKMEALEGLIEEFVNVDIVKTIVIPYMFVNSCCVCGVKLIEKELEHALQVKRDFYLCNGCSYTCSIFDCAWMGPFEEATFRSKEAWDKREALNLMVLCPQHKSGDTDPCKETYVCVLCHATITRKHWYRNSYSTTFACLNCFPRKRKVLETWKRRKALIKQSEPKALYEWKRQGGTLFHSK
jgi:hypothetical protein